MSEDVTIHYRWNADEGLNGYRWHFRQRPLRQRVTPWVIIIGSMLCGVVYLVRSEFRTALPPLLFGSILYVLYFIMHPRTLRRQLLKRPDQDSDVEWQVASDGIRTRNDHGTSEFKWSGISKVVQTPMGFLFYSNAQIFHWVPRHGFADDADFQRVSDLAQSHAAKFETIG